MDIAGAGDFGNLVSNLLGYLPEFPDIVAVNVDLNLITDRRPGFNDAGIIVSRINDIIDLGIYITTAVKCGKTKYSIDTNTIKECSYILGKEIRYFNNVEVYMLMGDVAIKAMNYIC